jgi:hypothetical protein
MAGDFSRSVKEDLIKDLIKTELWKTKLKADCKAGEVFLALRKDAICFYYKGRKLLSFDGKDYSTCVKNASVIAAKAGEIKEKQLAEVSLIKSFVEGYDRLKENCKAYACCQVKGASVLWHACSYLSKEPSVVVDIDVSLGEGAKDTVDLLIFNKGKQTLRLVEVVYFGSKDLWAAPTSKVVKSIQANKELLKTNKKSILSEYAKYINCLNMVFKSKLKTPTTLDDRIALTIYGYDGCQLNDKQFTNKVKKNPAFKDIPFYCKGDIEQDFLARYIWKKTEPPKAV